jgi:hypothetical protein
MSESPAVQISTLVDWQMPLSLEHYDRSPALTQAEREALSEVIVNHVPRTPLLPLNRPSTHTLARLIRPLQDVHDFKQCHPGGRASYLYCMCQQMLQTNKPFWVWSKEEWLKVITSANGKHGIAITIRVAAYLLCGLLLIEDQYFPSHLARLVFGSMAVAKEYERVATVIYGPDGFGYVRNTTQELHSQAALVLALLINRNPHIDALTSECLRATKQLLVYQGYQHALHQLVRALVYLKIVRETALTDLFGRVKESSAWWEYTEPDVDPTWLAWVQAYVTQTTRGVEHHRKDKFYRLLIAGRWLKKYHPEIVEPAQWDEPLAYEYVAWVCHAKRNELVLESPPIPRDASKTQLPLQATTIDVRISVLRRFFLALQRRPYQVSGQKSQRLVRAFDPNEVLVTPENIQRQMAPNPRTLDPAWWHKLTWAAASLSAKDLPSRSYPLAYYRAVALVWVTGARRANEIRRLKVGCVSREWAPEMCDEDGHQMGFENNRFPFGTGKHHPMTKKPHARSDGFV